MDLKGVTLLGKYEVEKPLGEGGMGAVWLGRHKLLGRKVAIKVLDDRFLNHAEVVERFGREARAASAVQHPGIVEVLDIDKTADGIPFLVMELLDGEPLASRIERVKRMEEKDAVEVLRQLLEALDAAHDAGIVHRDLKPDNVFLVPRRRGGENVKILDFGISHKSDEQGMKLTLEGSVLGTPHYMSPEQAMGKKDIDQRADIYAAGVLFYECLTGEVPFDADNYNALILKILSEEARSPSELGVQLSDVVEGTVMSSIAKDRDLRPATCQQMLEMLRGERPPTVPLKGRFSSGVPTSLDLPSQPPTGKTVPQGSIPAAAPQRRSRKRSTEVEDIFKNSARQSAPHTQGLKLELDLDAQSSDSPGSDGQSSESQTTSQPALDAPRVSGHVQPAAPRTPGWGLKALLIALVGGGLVFAVTMALKPSADEAPLRDDNAADQRAETTGQLGTVVDTPEPSKMVDVTLRGLPAAAKVKHNGFPAATFPLRARRGAEQEVEVSAEGFRTQVLKFVADEDKVLSVRLVREDQDFHKLEVPIGEDATGDERAADDDTTGDDKARADNTGSAGDEDESASEK